MTIPTEAPLPRGPFMLTPRHTGKVHHELLVDPVTGDRLE